MLKKLQKIIIKIGTNYKFDVLKRNKIEIFDENQRSLFYWKNYADIKRGSGFLPLYVLYIIQKEKNVKTQKNIGDINDEKITL